MQVIENQSNWKNFVNLQYVFIIRTSKKHAAILKITFFSFTAWIFDISYFYV